MNLMTNPEQQEFTRGGRATYSWGDPFFMHSDHLNQRTDTRTSMTATQTIKPLNDRIVCKKLEADDRTTGGIVLPDQHKGMPTRGTVVAVGPGWIDDLGNRHTLNVSIGDTILFTKHAGTTFKLNGDELLVLTEGEVLAIIEPPQEANN